MAMQVPYTGVPGQTLEPIATPEMNPRVPQAAFGGEVAASFSTLGKAVEGAGNELFARALSLQNLNNETEAKEADAKYMIGAGELHAKYSSLEGKAAVDAYPKYAKDLQDLRQQTRGSLSNPMAQKMFDGSSLSTMGRSIFNGAGHAATQQKAYVVGTAAAQVDLDAKSVEDNPKDEGLFAQKVQRTKDNVATVAAAHGYESGGAQEKDLALKATSKLWSQRLVGLSRTDPFEAARQLDANKTNLTQDDYLRVDNTVRAQGRAVGSVNIANEVYNAGKETPTTPGKSLAEMEAEARAKAKALNPDDPLLEQHAVTAVRGVYNQDRYAQKQEMQENEATVNRAIVGGVKNEQEFRADPKNAAAADALIAYGKKRLNLPAEINNYNQARDRKDNEARFNTLMGTANNDVEGFLNFNARGDDKLSQPQINQIIKKQEQLKQQPMQDPRVDRAIGWMRGAMGSQMEAMGVYKRTESNKDDYDHLTGTVQSSLDIWIENHGKPPSYKEFNEQIAPQILQQKAEPGWLWGTNKKPFYNQTAPTKFQDEVKAEVIAKGGVEPTQEQLDRAYMRTQLLKLYPSGKSAQ